LTELVGREEELDLLLRRWSKAQTGEGQVVLLSGEPGIGKARFAINNPNKTNDHWLARNLGASRRVNVLTSGGF
jgi:hypothetical protein